MNAVEHYKAAEQALDGAKASPMGSGEERYYLDAALVHATLCAAAGGVTHPRNDPPAWVLDVPEPGPIGRSSRRRRFR